MFQFFLTPIVKRILIINFVIFILLNPLQSLMYELALTQAGLLSFKIYQLITYQFLHGGFGHIFGNMLLLFFLGPELERRWGGKNFLIVYLAAGAFAGLAEVLLAANPYMTIIGASGAVMAVFTAYTLYYPNREILLYFLFPVKIKYLFLFYLIGDLVGVMPGTRDGIAHFAHLGGVLLGYLAVKYFATQMNSSGQGWNTGSYTPPKSSWGGSGQVPSFMQRIQSFFEKQKSTAQEQKFTSRSKADSFSRDKLKYYREEVDRLLDKINKVGYLQLSDVERKELEEASDYLKKFDSN